MTKFYPETDLAYVYRVEQEANRMRNEEIGRWIGKIGHGIGNALRKLDMWFEGARAVNQAWDSTYVGAVTGRYHLPAVFSNAEKVFVTPANANEARDRRAA
jgi:hypothetical protein